MLMHMEDGIENIHEIFGNPFDAVTPEELAQYAGKLVAVSKNGNGILGAASTQTELYAAVSASHPHEQGYLVQSVPNISTVTQETYARLCESTKTL